MTDIVERLRWLTSRDAERLSDFDRINQFVKYGFDAADEIERLRKELAKAKSRLAHCDAYIERLLLEGKK